jgi:hypothetical protein
MILSGSIYQFCNNTLLKQWMLLVFLFACCLKGYTQEPPPYFTFDYRKLAANKDSLLQRFEFSTFNFKDSLQVERGNKFDWEKEILISSLNNNTASIFIYSESLAIPYKGSIIRLSIGNKYSKKIMNIFIRVSYDIGYGDFITLKHLRFYPGNYFFDMCGGLSSEYKIPAQSSTLTRSIDLTRIRGCTISLKKLNNIIKSSFCIEQTK